MQIAIIDGIASKRETLKKRVTGQTTRLSLDAAVLDYASGSGFLADAEKNILTLYYLIFIRGVKMAWIQQKNCAASIRTACLCSSPPPLTMH